MKAVEPDVETMARKMISTRGMDPDQLVQPGSPTIYGTPMGDAFSVVPGAEQPLWRSYIPIAREYLGLAREVLITAPPALDFTKASEASSTACEEAAQAVAAE